MDTAFSQIKDRIQAALADGTPLCIRGGGTKDFYGETPQGEPLDTRGLSGITSYEPSELVVTVRAGTPLAELEARLAEEGQCLPFEPPRFAAGGTVGGMVAAGLSGPARANVGAVRDYVLGAEIVNGRAEVLRFGGTVMKNVAGYDVSRVLAGSLGVLGLIAEVSLKVLPVSPAEATLVFECTEADALRLLNEWGGRPLPLNASVWQGRVGSAASASDVNQSGVLTLRLRGAVAAVEAACRHLGGERQDPERAAESWQQLRDQTHPWFANRAAGDLWRLSVPQTAPALSLGAAQLIEWHGGQRWIVLPPGEGQRLREAARAVGGSAMQFIAASAVGTGATAVFDAKFDVLSPPLARIHAALKREFDPHGIFNPGRLGAQV